jgi:hypothetical protein
MSETHEVAMPGSTATPEHTMSPEGAARLAALSPDQRQIPDEPQTRIVDPEELDDKGEPKVEPKAPADPQAERVAPRHEVDADAIEPLAVSDAYREEAEHYRQDVANIVADTNIPAAEANAFYQMAGSMAAEMLSTDESNAILLPGQNAGPSMRNPDETHSRLLNRYGPSMYGAVCQAAAKEFAALPESVRAYLSAPNDHGDRLENHPAIVISLAFRSFTRLSPEAAEQEMGRLRSSESFLTGDKLTLDKIRALAFVIAGKRPQAPSAPQPNRGIVFKRADYGTRGGDPSYPTQGTQAAAALRAELDALSKSLYDSKGEMASNPKKRKAAIARRAEIQTQLGGGA